MLVVCDDSSGQSNRILTTSVVILCLNEREFIGQTLDAVFALTPKPLEVIVVDGGSRDNTVEQVRTRANSTDLPVRVIEKKPGDRGAQMNVGAAASQGEIVCFLHADTRPPVDLLSKVQSVLSREGNAICAVQSKYEVGGRTGWVISGLNFLKTYFIPLVFFPRCFFTQGFRLFFGDQLICSRRHVWEAAGGFREGGIMEDADYCLSVAKLGLGRARFILDCSVTTSGRRCEEQGFCVCVAMYLYLTFRWAFRRPIDHWKEGYENYRQ